jgi:hypothetical protein
MQIKADPESYLTVNTLIIWTGETLFTDPYLGLPRGRNHTQCPHERVSPSLALWLHSPPPHWACSHRTRGRSAGLSRIPVAKFLVP